MAYKAFNEDFFKRMLQAAKGKPVNYAFVLDKSNGKHSLALDNSKALDAESLFKKLRSHTKIPKGSYGTCVVQGGTFVLTPEQNVAGLKRAVKELAKQKGWKQKECKLTVPDMEEDDEGEPGKPAEDPAPAPSPTQRAQETAAESSSATATREQTTPDDPETTSSSEQAESSAESSAPDDAAEPGEDLTGAELEQLAAAVEKGSDAWEKAVKGATRDVKKLEKTVAGLDDPRVDGVVERLRVLVKDLPSLDKQLDTFLAAARKKDSKGAAKCQKDLQKAVRACRRFVEEEELIDIAESNPMSRVKLRDPLSKALKLIEKAIK